MIKATGIEKAFGSLKVLKGVEIEIGKAEVVSIMGASGAGKSTLLQILGTLSTPDSGSLIIDDVDVLKLDSKALAEFRNLRLGFVFQFHHLLPEFTALENVMIPAFIAGTGKKEAEQLRSGIKTGDKVTTIGGITGTVVSVKDDKFVLETGADQVRIEFGKWALSTNDTAAERAKEEQKKADEAKAKAKAQKKAEKNK